MSFPRERPASKSPMAFIASVFARISIVSMIASMRSLETRKPAIRPWLVIVTDLLRGNCLSKRGSFAWASVVLTVVFTKFYIGRTATEFKSEIQVKNVSLYTTTQFFAD